MSKASKSKSAPKLTLVVSNPAPAQEDACEEEDSSTEGFSIEIHDEGDQVYYMVAKDPSHRLGCVLKLEVIENLDDYGIGVVCHFPKISDKAFIKFVSWDDTLYVVLMLQFQMNLMEELLMFCGDHHASGLVVYVDDDQAKLLAIYESLIVHQDQVLLKDLGEKTVLVISSGCEAFDKWIDFMEDTTHGLHQTLWAEQRLNPVVRAYLKAQQENH